MVTYRLPAEVILTLRLDQVGWGSALFEENQGSFWQFDKWQACAVISGIIMLCGVVFLIRFVINFRQAWAENREKVDHWTRSVEWSPDGRRLAAGIGADAVQIWDAATGGLIGRLLSPCIMQD